MLNSMTGYGEAEGMLDGVSYAIELKAVNNRYLKTIIKLPDTCTFVEEDIDKELRRALSRGTINCVLRFKSISANALFEIDEAALRSIVARLNEVSASVGVKGQIDLAGLLALPGIVRPVLPDEETSAKVRELVARLTREAVDKLKRMREVEGKFLEVDLMGHCDAMARELEIVAQRSGSVVTEYAKRVRSRVDEPRPS
jgi:uncharacterized protein (TIGR00255 family)